MLSNSLEKNKDWLFIAFFVCLALGISFWIHPYNNFIGYDGVYYARVGENLFTGKGISANTGEPYTRKPSFYPFLIGFANLFFRDSELAGHIVSIFAFALTVIPLYLSAKTIYSPIVANWAALLYVTNGYLHLNGDLVMTEATFTFFVILLFFYLNNILRAEKPPLLSAAFLGIIGGVAFLTRLEGILFFCAAMFSFLIFSSLPLFPKIKWASLATLFFLLFFIPYAHFIHRHSHQWQLGDAMTEIIIRRQMDVANPGKYLELKKFYRGLTEDKTRMKLIELTRQFDLKAYLVKDNFALIRSFPASFTNRLLDLNKYLFAGLGFFFIGASLLSAPWDFTRKKSEITFLLFLITFLVQLFGEFIPKRYYPYFPIFLIWMGNGIEVLRNWAKETFNLKPHTSFGIPLGACLVFAIASLCYMHQTVLTTPMPLEYKEMGVWMKQNILNVESERVVTSHPAVNFYSGSQMLNPPYFPYVNSFEDFLIYMKNQKAKYFVISSDMELPIRDCYQFLLKESSPLPPGIIRKYAIDRKIKVMLFENTALKNLP